MEVHVLSDGVYEQDQVAPSDDTVRPVLLPDLTLTLADVVT